MLVYRARYLRFIRSYQKPIIEMQDYSIVVPMLNGLGEMLLKRSNHAIMMKYISSKHNLKVILEALRRRSSKVRSEAFHILKIFVVNPRQPYVIRRLLAANAVSIEDVLLKQFEHFQSDEALIAELKVVLSVLRALPEKHESSADRDPAWYAITQADDEVRARRPHAPGTNVPWPTSSRHSIVLLRDLICQRDIGVHTAAAFKKIQADKLVAAYTAIWGADSGTASEGEEKSAEAVDAASDDESADANPAVAKARARNLLWDALRSPHIYPDLTQPEFSALLNAPNDRRTTGALNCATNRSFDVVYLYNAFADKTEAVTYLVRRCSPSIHVPIFFLQKCLTTSLFVNLCHFYYL